MLRSAWRAALAIASLAGRLDPGARRLAEGDGHLATPLRRLEAAPRRQHRRDRKHDEDNRLSDMAWRPLLERLPHLVVPTLVIAGVRDPLVKIANAPRLAVLPHVDAVRVPGAHALNYSDPQLIAELIEAHIAGEPLVTQTRAEIGRGCHQR